MPLARPNKFFDAANLERWAAVYAPHIFSAWELSDACEYLDFWDWLDLNHPGVFGEFEQNWRAMEEEARRDAARRDEARRMD